ncbi:MAG: HIT family protein [Candidatus Colwellbacteria bacterium]|nr:HIT family protein [Candidatus Colwellbacteria bacterium]
MACIFCTITAGAIPAYRVYEDDVTVAFLDISPLAIGHTVVVPRSHAATVTDLSDELVGPLFLAVKQVTKLLGAALGAENFTIGINHGTLLGHPDIAHLHVHVIPRFRGDGGGNIHTIVNNPPRESLDQVLARIRAVYPTPHPKPYTLYPKP